MQLGEGDEGNRREKAHGTVHLAQTEEGQPRRQQPQMTSPDARQTG